MQLSIQSISKTYSNGVEALKEVDLELSAGMFGLLGPNGAGKSTLMRIIATLQNPDAGNAYFNDIDILNSKTSLRKILGYLPQDFGLYPKDTAKGLLNYLAILKGMQSAKDRNAKVQEVLELTNLTEVGNKRVGTYSGGMKQRFGIAQLLLNDPKLVIVDEPTAGLDPVERNRFLNILRNIGSSRIVIFSTHLVEDVKDLCHQMVILNKGTLGELVSPQDAVNSLADKIWETSDPEIANSNQVKKLSAYYNSENKEVFRVFTENKEGLTLYPTQSKLEDYYFLKMNS
jgi:ABC-type multidrug transport system ATPase subunit